MKYTGLFASYSSGFATVSEVHESLPIMFLNLSQRLLRKLLVKLKVIYFGVNLLKLIKSSSPYIIQK